MLPGVLPVGGNSSYLASRQERFDFSPNSYDNFLLFQKRVSSSPKDYVCDYKPWKYQVEPNSSCNLNCTFCAVSTWSTQKRAENLELETFKHIIDENDSLLEVNLCPLGEPLLRGDDYFTMGRYTRNQKIWTRTVTNATLLHSNGNFEKLASVGFNEIVFSIDSFVQETYESLRVGSKLSKVLDNITLYHNYCIDNNLLPNSKLNAVITAANYNQIPHLISSAYDIGFTSVSITIDPFNWGLDSLNNNNNFAKADLTSLLELHHKWLSKGLYVGFVLTNNKFDHNTSNLSDRCSWPLSAMYIGSDIRYTPCCHIGDPDVYEIKHARSSEQPILPLELWFSTEYSLFREQHLTGCNLSSTCSSCYKNDI